MDYDSALNLLNVGFRIFDIITAALGIWFVMIITKVIGKNYACLEMISEGLAEDNKEFLEKDRRENLKLIEKGLGVFTWIQVVNIIREPIGMCLNQFIMVGVPINNQNLSVIILSFVVPVVIGMVWKSGNKSSAALIAAIAAAAFHFL